MPVQPYVEPSVVPFVDSQFDVSYREDAPQFVAFVREYYRFMEQSNGAIRMSRGFLDLRDVDRTSTDFLVSLKQKYVNGLRLDTLSDTRQLVKHAKDLYRAKGTTRALDLFFRLLYDEVASVYYPKDDILVASSGTWVKPRYLELSISPDNLALEGKSVRGLTSGATAFVDAVVRRRLGDRLSETAYLSSIDGKFLTGEVVVPSDGSLDTERCPSIVGSMNELFFDASGSGSGYEVGDVLPVNSPYGVLGLARVSEVVDQAGLISLNLINGGYGYSNTSTLYVSDTVVNVSNVIVSNSYAHRFFRPFAVVTQNTGSYHFRNGTGTIAAGDVVRAWSNSTNISGNGVVLSASYTNSTAGTLFLQTQSGNLATSQLWVSGNGASANLSALDGGYVDSTAVGFIVGTASTVLSVDTVSGSFVPGDQVIQKNVLFPTDGSVQGQGIVSVQGNNFISLTDRSGAFRLGPISSVEGATANVTGVQVTAGIKVTNGAFSILPGNILEWENGTGTLSFQGLHVSASFGILPVLDHTEQVALCTDTLATFCAANSLAGPYGFTAMPSGNSTTNWNTMLSYQNTVIGTITGVYTITTGAQLDSPPIVMLADQKTQFLEGFDLTVKYANSTASFAVGEIVTQAATGARGLVKSVNSTSLSMTNLRLNLANGFIYTTNSTTTMVGLNSGAVANVLTSWADRDNPQTGRNANVVANTVTAQGAVTKAQVIDSGFGYVDGETVWIGEGTNPGGNAALGVVDLQTYGTGRGFYTQNGGFLSANKKLFDGDFYQNFSYQVTSGHQLAKYVDTLKQVVHVAGMKVFGRYLHVGSGSRATSSPGASIIQS